MEEVLDLTSCIGHGKTIKVGRKEYKIEYNYRALKSLEEQYGNVGTAIDKIFSRENIYDDVLNFLYAACGEKYGLKKTDIEEWITLSTVNPLFNTIYEVLIGSFGASSELDAGEQ